MLYVFRISCSAWNERSTSIATFLCQCLNSDLVVLFLLSLAYKQYCLEDPIDNRHHFVSMNYTRNIESLFTAITERVIAFSFVKKDLNNIRCFYPNLDS